MPVVSPLPRLKFARKGANPTLETMEFIRASLIAAAEPVSRNRILRTLSEWNHTTTRRSLNAALGFLEAHQLIEEGPKGVLWLPGATPAMVQALRAGRRL